jgi:DNA-binding transcriptional MerR regulator
VNDRSYLAIGEVLALLQEEFPDVTISKIRFLESQGLINPERTPSGYRKFYPQDIDRLRFILHEQKEHFLPLKVIKDRLTTGDVPVEESAVTPAEPAEERLPIWMTRNHPAAQMAAVPSTPEEPLPAGPPALSLVEGGSEPVHLTFDELAAASGLTADELREVEGFGLLTHKQVGNARYYDDEALRVARTCSAFLRFGVEPRHLRSYRVAAEREAGLFEQVILPLVKQRNPQARADAATRLHELRRLGGELRDAMLRQALRSYTEG